RRFTYDTIGHNDEINLGLIRMVGADRVVLGSDYCFNMGLADPVGTVERLGALTAAERNLIIGETAAKSAAAGIANETVAAADPDGPFAIITYLWGRSSAGRASRSQCEGRGFDPLRLHKKFAPR